MSESMSALEPDGFSADVLSAEPDNTDLYICILLFTNTLIEICIAEL
ncbi:hypothetical protein LCGC14_0045690 [marine sediment metagenome]|uniref:Uncharacterized protein n=1 Tax=marine sediment metagenome TaxID=412755 RepID=A0A0F9YUV8_9ZZZZ